MSPPPPRGRVVTALLRLLAGWGRRRNCRVLVYAVALAATTMPLVRVYRVWMAWPGSVTGPVVAPTPSGTVVWFKILEDRLLPLDGPAADAVGIDFQTSSAAIEPPGRNMVFRVHRVEIASVQWADPSREPPPDLDAVAELLIATGWVGTEVEYAVSERGPGVYEGRYLDPAGMRAYARRQAWTGIPAAAVRWLSLLLVGECLAWAGRRVRLWRPGECRACGYPVGDLASAVCPECGTPRDAEREPAA